MIKILHIITRLDMGGSAQNTLQTCLGLGEKYKMVLAHGLSLESMMTDREKAVVEKQVRCAEKRGVRVIPIPSLVRSIDPIKDLAAFWSLFYMIRRERPVIVHTHSSKAGFLGRWAARVANVPIVVHTTHGHVFYGHFGPLASRIFLAMEKMTARITDRMIALTEGERHDYLKFGLCSEPKTVTIHSGVDVDRFVNAETDVTEKRIKLGLNPEKLVVGAIGWLLPIKGPMILLRAMARVWKFLPDIQLIYVGKGDMLEELKTAVSQMDAAEKVKFLGWRDDVHKIIPVLDLLVLPSLNEGMGRVLVEAMAAGKPIVASRTGGVPDLVRHKRNGLLVPPGDEKALAEAINWMVAHPAEARQMGEFGRGFCRRFSLDAMLEKIDALYRDLLDQKGFPHLN